MKKSPYHREVYESQSSVNTLLNCNVEEQPDGRYFITVGVFHTDPKSHKEITQPTNDLSFAEAKIYCNQIQQIIDRKLKNSSIYKRKNKSRGRR